MIVYINGNNEKYTEILLLRELLRDERIPHFFQGSDDGYEILYAGNIVEDSEIIGKVTQNRWSLGHEQNLVEVSGRFIDDDTLGYINAIKALELIKKDWCKDGE